MLEIFALVLLSQQPLYPVTEGYASYYTVASSSTLTASGERFRDDKNTCAMLNGNFGEYYLIVCEETGNSVVCKLNDRGPYIKNRVVDLSESAMKVLDDDLNEGILKVKVYPLGTSPPPEKIFNN